MEPETKSSHTEVEHIKAKSDYLRGTLKQSLENPITGALYPDDTHLIKFHGSYQQTDRDLDTERKAQKLEPLYSFMIRVRVPGGIATPAQWLRMDDLADRYGNGTLKLTTRQAFQLHGIRKRHLKTVVRGFNEVWLDSIAGCGDVNRNVMCSPNPDESRIHAALSEVARELSAAFTPQTTSYYEIWLDGEPVDASQPFSTQKTAGKDEEPVYGKTYLPRKFKIALAVPPQNDTDVFANDIGLIAIGQDGELAGFNVVAGGGLGMTFGQPETFPRLADPLGYIDKQDVVKICEAIITTQRDHGNRENRRLSRLKYTVERLGLAAFKQEIESRSGVVFQPEQPYRFEHSGDRLGWTQTHEGRFHLTLFVEGGRVADQPDFPLKTALRVVATIHDGDFRLTGNQNLVIGNISPEKQPAIEAVLEKYGVLEATFRHTALRQNSIACVALNTCSQAFAEAERYLPSLIDKIDLLIRSNGLEKEAVTIRMTGCPNGCGRPYLAEIGLVGKSPGYYNLYLGGAHNGERLNKLYREMLDEAGMLRELEPLLSAYARHRDRHERFGDFVIRKGYVKETTHGTNFHVTS
ncbi:MAG: NADPH-dependent assimilatory sulfite reductase hemoprotein subunit [Saprospiraceae bacterium]|nr:NADPH-dependent assimilatory sulfite reductase hemoprotein subunit [Saprospiraceae bacterium]